MKEIIDQFNGTLALMAQAANSAASPRASRADGTAAQAATLLGSHNSMSYLRPAHWWGWIMIPFARCQRKTLAEQLAAGVRCFDLRISFDGNGSPRFRHGWCRFQCDETLTGILRQLADSPGKTYVRLLLEEPLSPWNTIKRALGFNVRQKPDPAGEYYFPRLCRYCRHNFAAITFLGGCRKYDWALLYDFGTDDIPLHQWVSSMDDEAPWWQRLLPRRYARRHNAARLQNLQPGINLFDFI